MRADGTLIAARKENGRWSVDGATLRLRWGEADPTTPDFTETLHLAPGSNVYVGRTASGHVIRCARAAEDE